jgi:glucose 1-dehydrogenase/3-oxoacyl-[acyl-carrier protein] reductase
LGIRVNTISPGLTATKANSNQWQNDPELWQERGKDIPLGRPGRPEDLAGAAVFLASTESEWMTGGDIAVDGGEVAL